MLPNDSITQPALWPLGTRKLLPSNRANVAIAAVRYTGTFRYDDLQCLSDSLSTTTGFAVNEANELTSMTDPNGTTSFGFDAWGRMTSKARGSLSATYGYKYAFMLCSVFSNWPGETGVTYDYGADWTRRERTVNGATTLYRWDGA